MLYEKSVGVVIFRKSDQTDMPEFLFLEAPNLKTNRKEGDPTTYWSFPKGKQEKGETDMQTASREVLEETGLSELKYDPNFKHKEKYFYRRDGELVNKTVAYFIAELKMCDQEVKLSFEHVSYKWVAKDEGLTLLRIKAAKEVLETAYTYITTGVMAVQGENTNAAGPHSSAILTKTSQNIPNSTKQLPML